MSVRTRLLTVVLLLAVIGCEGTTVPERRELLGSWSSQDFEGATIRFTVAETARSVDGAGSWSTPTESLAFRVLGAIAGSEVSLFFDFPTREGINFQGVFRTADIMEGRLSGGGYRDRPITFQREVLE